MRYEVKTATDLSDEYIEQLLAALKRQFVETREIVMVVDSRKAKVGEDWMLYLAMSIQNDLAEAERVCNALNEQ